MGFNDLNTSPGNLKGQIEEIMMKSGTRTHESRIYFRAEIQKYFVSFLVQTVEFAFEIN